MALLLPVLQVGAPVGRALLLLLLMVPLHYLLLLVLLLATGWLHGLLAAGAHSSIQWAFEQPQLTLVLPTAGTAAAAAVAWHRVMCVPGG